MTSTFDKLLLYLLAVSTIGCIESNDSFGGGAPTAADFGCTYPDAPAAMVFEEPLAAYGWPEAYDVAGESFPLHLGEVHCQTDGNRDWSQIDYLYFISLPAW